MAPRCPQNNFRTFQHDSRKLLTVRSLQMSSDPRLSLSSFIPILSRPAISSSRPELLAVSPTLHALSRLLNFPARHCFCLETAYFSTPTMAHHGWPATARHGPPLVFLLSQPQLMLPCIIIINSQYLQLDPKLCEGRGQVGLLRLLMAQTLPQFLM